MENIGAMKHQDEVEDGIGFYSQAEASRILAVRTASIGRWLKGSTKAGTFYPPLWKPKLVDERGTVFLSFRDLIETLVTSELVKTNIPLQRLRKAIEVAREVVGDWPLSSPDLKTDGKSLFLILRDLSSEEDSRVLNLQSRQYNFERIIERSLKNIEYDRNEPTKWRPGGRKSGVVLDPTRNFGSPTIEECNVPTSVLAKAMNVAGEEKIVAREWNVPIKAVRQAVAYEKELATRAIAA